MKALVHHTVGAMALSAMVFTHCAPDPGLLDADGLGAEAAFPFPFPLGDAEGTSRVRDAEGKSRAPYVAHSDAPLFDGAPSVHEARQGALGDCWLIAPMAAIAHKRPGYLQSHVCSEETSVKGERTFQVRLFRSYDGQEQWIALDDTFPYRSGKLRFAHPANGYSAIWAAVIEKAVATYSRPSAPSYAHLNKASGITGHRLLSGHRRAKSRRIFGRRRSDIHALLTRVVVEADFPATVKRVQAGAKKGTGHRQHEMIVERYDDKVLHLIDQRTGKPDAFTLHELVLGKEAGGRLTHLNWSEIPLPEMTPPEQPAS